MALYKIVNSDAVEWRGEILDGIRHPLNIEYKWAEVDLNAIGLYKPVEADPIPEGQISTDRTMQLVNGVPTWVHTLEAAPVISITTDDVNEYRTSRIEQGHEFYVTGIPTVIRVTGRPQDADTILALALSSQMRVGAGDTTTTTQYRDGNNIDHNLTPPQIIELWTQSVAWVEKVYKASWVVKGMDPIPQDYQAQFEAILETL